MSATDKLRRRLLAEKNLRKRVSKFRAGNIAMSNAASAAEKVGKTRGAAPESVLKHSRAARRIRNLP